MLILSQTEPPPHQLPGLRALFSVAAIIGVVAYAGVALTRQFGDMPMIWPSDGVMLAILLGVQGRFWPGYILAGIAGNILAMFAAGFSADLATEFPLANFTGVILSAAILRGHVSTITDLSKLKNLPRFILLASGACPLLVEGENILIIHFQYAQMGHAFYVASFLSHSLGLMTVTPAVLAYRGKQVKRFITSGRVWLALPVAALLLGITVAVFTQSSYPLLYMVYPPLVLMVCLFRLPGGAIGLFLVTLVSLCLTQTGHGPAALITTHNPMDRLIFVQVFAGAAALLVLGLAAVLGDLDRAREQLNLAKEALALLAQTDSLTGLANRRRLDEVLQRESRRAARNQTCLALLMIDADNFKAYNDHYGHPAGDECLRALSTTIAQFSTRPGDLTARYGGEELVVLLAETGHLAAVGKAEQIRQAVQEMALPHAGNPDHGSVVTVSIGISAYDPGISVADPHAILAWGDKMLYEAKRTGKNKSVSSIISPAANQALPQIYPLQSISTAS